MAVGSVQAAVPRPAAHARYTTQAHSTRAGEASAPHHHRQHETARNGPPGRVHVTCVRARSRSVHQGTKFPRTGKMLYPDQHETKCVPAGQREIPTASSPPSIQFQPDQHATRRLPCRAGSSSSLHACIGQALHAWSWIIWHDVRYMLVAGRCLVDSPSTASPIRLDSGVMTESEMEWKPACNFRVIRTESKRRSQLPNLTPAFLQSCNFQNTCSLSVCPRLTMTSAPECHYTPQFQMKSSQCIHRITADRVPVDTGRPVKIRVQRNPSSIVYDIQTVVVIAKISLN